MSDQKKEKQISISSRVGVRDLAISLKILKKKYDITPPSRAYAVSLIIKAYATSNIHLLEDRFLGEVSEEDYQEFLDEYFSKRDLFLEEKG